MRGKDEANAMSTHVTFCRATNGPTELRCSENSTRQWFMVEFCEPHELLDHPAELLPDLGGEEVEVITIIGTDYLTPEEFGFECEEEFT